MSLVRVEIPSSLRLLSGAPPVIAVEVTNCITQRSVLDAIEVAYPALLGTLRDQNTKLRRPFIRFFACGIDLSHASPDKLLPEPVASGEETFLIVGAIAGG